MSDSEMRATAEDLAALDFEPVMTLQEVEAGGVSNEQWLEYLANYRAAAAVLTRSKGQLIAGFGGDGQKLNAAVDFLEEVHAMQTYLKTVDDILDAASARMMAALTAIQLQQQNGAE